MTDKKQTRSKSKTSNGASELANAQQQCMAGIDLDSKDKRLEAIQHYDSVITLYSARAEMAFAKVVATAMFNKAVSLGVLQQSEAAIESYAVLTQQYEDRVEPELRRFVIEAMMNQAYRLGLLQRGDASIALYERAVKTFAKDSDPTIAGHVQTLQAFLAERQVVLNEAK